MCRRCSNGQIPWVRPIFIDSDDQIPSNVEINLGLRKSFRESKVPDPQWSWILGAREGYSE